MKLAMNREMTILSLRFFGESYRHFSFHVVLNHLKSESNKLASKLNELQERLNSRETRSQRSDKIFSQIARKTMERKDKSKLMYAIPKDRQPGERSNF